MKKKNIALAIGISAFALFSLSPQSALAVAENDPCTAAQEGEWRQLDSPNGSTHLYCNGSNWLAFRKFETGDIVFNPGGNDVLKIQDEKVIVLPSIAGQGTPDTLMVLDDVGDVDAASPGADECLKYNDTSGNWEAGSCGLWTSLSATRAHFGNAGTEQVGIGTNNPGFTLEVNGTAAKTGGGSWFVASDARLKDITGQYGKGLEEIVRLRPIRFVYTKDNEKGLSGEREYVGFVAQDVRPVFPEAVSEGADGYLNFDMHPVNVAVINAIRELKAENDGLRAVNADLLSRLETLEARIPRETEPHGYNE